MRIPSLNERWGTTGSPVVQGRKLNAFTYLGLGTDTGRKTGECSFSNSSDTSRNDALWLFCLMQEFKIILKLPMQFITKKPSLLNLQPQNHYKSPQPQCHLFPPPSTSAQYAASSCQPSLISPSSPLLSPLRVDAILLRYY